MSKSITKYGDYLYADLTRYWNAYPDSVGTIWRLLMMLFQWELHAVILYRLNFHASRMRIPILGPAIGYGVYVLQKLNEAVSGIRLPASIRVGPGFFILHTGNIGFHPLCKIGANFTVASGVSVAGKVLEQGVPAVPQIGDNVFLGAGAKVVGSVTIGNDVIVGANAVVVDDIPDGAVAVGNPARVVKIRS